MELVGAKLRIAEAEFEIVAYKGKVSKLSKQLERLGGSNLEQAKRTTNFEVRLAQALSQAASLKSENEALRQDVKGMIDLKLKVAELSAHS